MIPTTWQFPVNFTPKNYTSKINFKKKNFRFPKGVSGSVSKSENDHFGMWDRIFFFFCGKKVDHSVSWGEIYRRLLQCCNNFNFISGSQSKFEKTEFSIVVSTLFHRDPEIIM